MKILVGVSSCRDWKPQFGVNFAMAIATALKNGHEVGIQTVDIMAGAAQSLLPQARQNILDHAVKNGHTHIVMFDDDMVFPPDVIIRLAKHNKQVVFPNVCQKLQNKISGVVLKDDLSRLDSTGRNGLERVPYGTLACTMIEVAAFASLPRPHFEVMWSPSAGIYIGEDHYFFKKLGLEGVEFWCDHDLTQDVGHIGDYQYRFPHVETSELKEAA